MPKNIEIFTSRYCPYCEEIRTILADKKLPFNDTIVEKKETRTYLLEKTKGRKTLPQIFVGDQHIGGYDDFKELERTGELDNLG